MKCYCDINLHPLIWYHNEKQEKDYALLLSFVGQARLQFAGLHSLCLALWCAVIEIGGAMMDLLFWDLRMLPLKILHLHPTFSIT